MNYPVWQLDIFGGGFLIAVVAVVHVFVSHFAVGGGLFLVLVEMKGLRENNRAIIDYTKKHTKFFLLLTMVFGGMTGVGIWFTIALLNPAATSSLIHTFVFAWAIEWVFFFLEVLSLLLYYYTFNKISSRNHLFLGWLYFIFAWLSLFIINGVIDFMLTPGTWLENRDFWAGFFNPTFWPALFFRTFMALLIAGLFGFLTSVKIKDEELRHTMVRYCGIWLLVPLLLLLGSAWWYKEALPPEQQQAIFTMMPELKRYLAGFVYASPLLILGGLVMAFFRPQAVRKPVGWFLLIIGFIYMGCFEFIREGGRRPYIIYDYMYSNTILKKDLAKYQENGVLKTARWLKNREVTPENRVAAGRELYNLLCLHCHSIGGPLNNIVPRIEPYTPEGMKGFVLSMGVANPYMPPFPGNEEDASVLADFLATTLSSNGAVKEHQYRGEEVQTASFNPEESEYILLASTTLGMALSSNPQVSGIDFSFAPPTIRAQLFRRGETPELISEEAELSYVYKEAEGEKRGDLSFSDDYFQTALETIPRSSGTFKPYVIATLTARIDGEPVAETKVKIGVSTEAGCRNCHSGDWQQDDVYGMSRQTAANILEMHDKHSKTDLSVIFQTGGTIVCSFCHGDSARGTTGGAGVLNLSAAIHGFHSAHLNKLEDGSSCNLCHTSADRGATRSFDGIHKSLELDCSNCHGSIVDHAVSLLKSELAAGKKRADVLLKRVAGLGSVAQNEIKPRKPWVMEPDCLNCHEDFEAPDSDDGFNRWTEDEKSLFHNRTGEEEVILCISCHGPPHSLYPAAHAYGLEKGGLQPLQYQKSLYPIAADRGCAVCHTVEMDEELHHTGSLADFRNRVDDD